MGLGAPGASPAATPATSRSPHGPLNIPCQNCHTFTSWKPIRAVPEFNHSQTKYPLRGMHRSVACQQCHTNPVFSNVGMTCQDCHADIHRRQMGSDCANCHTVNGWNASLKSVQDHQNRFPLLGAHATAACEDCHKGAATGQFMGLSTDCGSCHMQQFLQTTSPPHQASGFSTQCQQCHSSMETFLGASFDHLKLTGFALTGAHATLDCTACHVGGKFQGTPSQCISCHQSDFSGTNNPNHIQAGFPTTCQNCHSTTTWEGANFDHNTMTKFPLTGAHATVQCTQCHVNGQFAGTPTDCASCHIKDFNGTNNPNHAQAGFPTTCATCHNTTSWDNANFNHNTFTKFSLTGAHVTVPCTQCHVNGQFAGTPTDCASCHIKDFNGTTNPNHATAGFPTTCATCHSTVSWDTSTFNHNSTPFPLTGAHVNVACSQCHVNNVFAGTPTDCASCHTKDFNGTTDPNHVAAAFPTTCQTCHNTTSWTTATFNHNTTPFPLTGAHVSVDCNQCHVNNKFAGLPTDCASCHIKDFNGTNNPAHAAAGFPTTCQTCHTTTNWTSATFNHNTQTTFPLTGAHVNVACNQCHVNNVFAGLSTTCASCHTKDFNGTTNPNHVAAGFPTDCSICHSTTSWAGATFNHSTTPFPLTGAHVNVACASCHVNNVFAGLPTTCVSCHQQDYNGTNNPAHASAGFPTTCDVCHNTTAWQPASFNHANTPFPLTGAHVNVACNQCHINNVFAGTPTDCYSCHKTDYNGTTNPNHASAGFPTTCQTCHTTTAWTGATFNHTWFPVPHRTATLCSDCHTNPADYSVFVCTNCHTQSQTDPNHRGVKGYVWNSANCYSCHPRGNS